MTMVSTTIRPPVRAFLDLFAAQLSAERFGDIDLEALHAREADVTRAVEALRAAQDALNDATAELEGAQRELEQLARQGHAYAQVFALAHPELAEQINDIVFDKPARSRRKRRRKPLAEPEPLPLVDGPAAQAMAG